MNLTFEGPKNDRASNHKLKSCSALLGCTHTEYSSEKKQLDLNSAAQKDAWAKPGCSSQFRMTGAIF